MIRLTLAIALALSLVACSEDPAESPECREWQDEVLLYRGQAALVPDALPQELVDALMADDRPDGCPWP